MLATIVEQASQAGLWETLKAYWSQTPWYWIVIGFGGQMFFFFRFFVQWIASERARRSVVPLAFWYLSILGGLFLLTYGVFFLRDPVIILGQTTGTLIYARNLQLIKKAKLADR